MLEENGVLIALFVAVFAAMFAVWWFSGKEKIVKTETPPTLPAEEKDIVDQVTPLLAEAYSRTKDNLDISVVAKGDGFARGGVAYADQREIWLGRKDEESWFLVYAGPGWPECGVLENNGVPVKIASECWQDGQLVKR